MRINLKTILAVATLLSVLVSILSTIQSMKNKSEAERFKNNLYTKTIEYNDELGRKVTETEQLEITVKELKAVSKKDSTKLSDYEKKILKISKELSYNDRSYKNTQTAIAFSSETEYSAKGVLKDTTMNEIKAKTIDFSDEYGKYSVTYQPQNDSLFLSLKMRNDFFVDMYKERATNKKGNKVFILWRWAKPWIYKGSIKTMNDSTKIKDFTILNIGKR